MASTFLIELKDALIVVIKRARRPRSFRERPTLRFCASQSQQRWQPKPDRDDSPILSECAHCHKVQAAPTVLMIGVPSSDS